MHALVTRVLDNAIPVAGLLFVLGVGMAGLGVAEPTVVAFLVCGTLLMFKSGLASAPKA